ncbi:MAG: response regulator, partial [Burkholderiaceae bacterium]
GNAIKYSESGGVSLHLSHQNDALGRDLLSFKISDTGVGIEAGAQATLFDRTLPGPIDEFGGRARPFAGSGLGLEIARTLARAMDGDIHVASEPGRGSVFTLEVRLPACEPAPARSPATLGGVIQPAAPVAARSLHILVSEDHDSNRAYLEAVLQRLGHRAVFCENGLEALQRLKQEDFDLVLLDLYTPMMDGYQAARAMRALPAPKSGVKLIGLSADALDETARQAHEAGMDDFLTKPVSIERLSQAMQRQALALPTGSTDSAGSAALPLEGQDSTGAPASAMPTPAATAAAAAAAAKPPVNEQTVAALRSNLPEAMVRKLYATYLNSLAETREALRGAQSRHDKEGLQKASHSIKGAAANLGLTVVSEPAHALEQSARQALDWQLIERQTAALLEALARSETLCGERGFFG